MFRAVPLPIIRSFPLYIRQWYMSRRFDDRFQARTSWSCLKAVIKPAWHKPMLNVQWKTPDDGQSNCPKHVEFLDKNKFGKLLRLLVLLRRKLSSASSSWTSRIHQFPEFRVASQCVSWSCCIRMQYSFIFCELTLNVWTRTCCPLTFHICVGGCPELHGWILYVEVMCCVCIAQNVPSN